MCADTISYSNPKFDNKFECDIGFVGGYWPYKGQVINKWFMPLLENIGEYRVKIFGNQPWPANQYCGFIGDKDVKNLFVSSKICPNLSEPHAQAFGIDVNERIFKVLYCGGFCVSDYVESYNIFGDGIIMAKSPEEFKSKIDHYLNNENERKEISSIGKKIVENNHTGFHRAASIMGYFGIESSKEKILNDYINNFQ